MVMKNGDKVNGKKVKLAKKGNHDDDDDVIL